MKIATYVILSQLYLFGALSARAVGFVYQASLGRSAPTLGSGPSLRVEDLAGAAISGSWKKGLVWTDRYFGWEISSSLEKEDALSLTFLNPGAEDIGIVVEIKDKNSSDYWSRVNYPLVIHAGLKTYTVPLRISKGEAARPGALLDRSSIRSIVLARSSESPATPGKLFLLELKALQLPDPFSTFNFSSGFYAFDFGPQGSEVFAGFREVSEATRYSDGAGYGFVNAEFWRPYKQATNVSGPDALDQDSLIPKSGEFWVKVPPGDYDLIFNIDHPGGFWGEVPYFKERSVWVNGKRLLHETQNLVQAADRYFQYDEVYDRAGEDFYDKYWAPRLPQKMVESVHADSVLKIRFNNSVCPQSPCFGMAPSYLVVFPVKDRLKLPAFLKKLRDQQRQDFAARMSLADDKRASPQVKPTSAAGQVSTDKFVFRADPEVELREAWQNKIPLESVSATFLTKEPVFVSLGVECADGSQKLNVTWVPPESGAKSLDLASVLETGIAHQRVRRTMGAANTYFIGEKDVVPQSSISLLAGDIIRVWFRAKDASLPSGLYHQKLKLELGKSQKTIDVTVRVLEQALPMTGFEYGPFFDQVSENYYFSNEMTERKLKNIEQSHQILRSFGMNVYSIEPKIRVVAKKPLKFDFHNLELAVNEAHRSGLRQMVLYSDVIEGFDICHGNAQDEYGLSRETFLQNLYKALEAYSKSHDWMPLRVVLCDEAGIEKNRELALILVALPKGDRLVMTYTSSDVEGRNVHSPTFPVLSYFKSVPTTPWGFYNRNSRAVWGAGTFYLSQLSQLQTRLGWVFNMNTGNPFFGLDGREDDLGWCRSRRDGQVYCDASFYRDVVGGMTDARYLTLLKNLSPKDPWASTFYKAEFEKLAKVDWGSKQSDVADFAGTRLKAQIIDHLLKGVK